MFKISSLKLYRKFLILGVLLAASFVVTSADRSSANRALFVCCQACYNMYNLCVSNCASQHPDNQQKFEQCVAEDCDPWFSSCTDGCGGC